METPLRYDHYKVLGIARDASTDEVKRAFRERAKRCHPDRAASPRAAETFRAVYEAWRILRDPASRAWYDRELAGYRPGPCAVPRTTRPPAPPVRRHEPPPTRWQRTAFVGLHLTGLFFGCCAVSSVAMGLAWHGWPMWTIVAAIPGLFAIPASWSGLNGAGERVHTRTSHPN